MQLLNAFGIIVVVATIALFFYIYLVMSLQQDGFANISDDPIFQTQMKMLQDTYAPHASGKRPVTDAIGTMPEYDQCFVNFYTLACRYPGYIGPMVNGHFSPDIGIQAAVHAGCRVFVLDIDYLDSCSYYPRLVVRDAQGKLQMNPDSSPLCQSPDQSNLKQLCSKINFHAFADSTAQKTDPLVIVLFFHRVPPGAYNSKTVLDYYSAVAEALAPFKNRILTNEANGGAYYRQKQEGQLLINSITDYSGKVLVFSNANTIGFRESTLYEPMKDLDYMTHLRLAYTQTQLGVTENGTGSIYGVLQTAEDFTVIPSNQTADIVQQTKQRWTICLPRDPSQSVSAEVYKKISNMGVNCVPAVLFDPASSYLFTDSTFKKHGFVPKPAELRYTKPPSIAGGKANPKMDANGGMLTGPTLPAAGK
jgi:hypothetical protein